MRCVNRKWIQSLILLAIPSFTASAQVATPLGSPTLTPLPIPPGCLTGTLPLPGCDNAMVGTIPRPSPPAWGGATFETVATAGSPFTATWSASGASAVAPAWQGTINVTGAAYPSSSEGNSTTTWNFSTLTDGKLPAGTLVNFGDLDDGSGQTEEYELTAYDKSGVVITSAWLNAPFFITDPSCTTGLASATYCVQASMPEYLWGGATGCTACGVGATNVGLGVYEFDGLNVAGNPTLTVWLTTNQDIYSLSVHKFTTNNSFVLAAPTIAPGYMEVCKASSTAYPVTGSFNFTITTASTGTPTTPPGAAGQSLIAVPVGACSGPMLVPAGATTIAETEPSGVSLSSVVASGYDPVTFLVDNRLISSDPPAGSAVVTVVSGDVPNETLATFTNQANNGQGTAGQLKICKIAGAGVPVGTKFNFTATSTSSAITQTYTVPAGPASDGGYCVVDNTTFPAGTTVKVVEPLTISTFYSVGSAVSPSGAKGGSAIVATLGTGITEVTFTNSVNVITFLPFPGDFNGGLSFSATPSSPPAPQMFSLTSAPVVPFTAAATVTSGPPGWLTVTPLSGTTPATITVSVTALPAGAYNGAIAIASTDPANPFSSTIPVTFIAAANAGFSFVGSMAQLAFAGGWNTIFTLVNTGTAPVQATLNFFDNNGNPLPVPLEFPQSSTTVGQPVTTTTLTVNPGAGQVIQTAGSATQTTQVGSAQLLANGSLSGFAVFQQTNGSRIQAAVVPLENRTPAEFAIWYDNTGGNATGIALANASAQAATVPVTISDDTGTILLSTTIPVAAEGHTSFDLASTYASTAGIRGSIDFGVPTGGQISVLGLEFSPLDAFTSIPAIAINEPLPTVTNEVLKTLH